MAAIRAAGLVAVLLFGVAQAAQPQGFYEIRHSDIVVAADGASVETIRGEQHARNDAEAIDGSRVLVPFVSGSQTVEVVEAYTAKADGSRIPVAPSTIFDQGAPVSGVFGVYSDLRMKILLFPQFEAGDTAVYTVRITTTHSQFQGRFLRSKPVAKSGHAHDIWETITAPRAMNLEIESKDVEFRRHEDGDNSVYEWHFLQPTEVALKGPLAAVLRFDIAPHYIATNFKDHADMGRAYAAGAQPKMQVTPRIKALADKITAGETKRREQARKIYEWVSKHIRYVAIELGQGTVVPHEADAILDSGFGDCKDHDVVLQALLKAKGIAAESVLIPAGMFSYTLAALPTLAQFNHVITYVPEFDVYLDSSLALAPFGVLMPVEYGKPVVRNSATVAVLANIPVMSPGLSVTSVSVRARLDKDGTITGTLIKAASGPDSLERRAEGIKAEIASPEDNTETALRLRQIKNGKGQFTQDSPVAMTPTYTTTTTFSSTGWTDWLAGKGPEQMPGAESIFMPRGVPSDFMLIFLGAGQDEPVSCYSQHLVEDVRLELPPGLRVRLPDNVTVSDANLTFTQRWSMDNGAIVLHRDFASNFRQAQCSKDMRKALAETTKKIEAAYHVRFSLHAEEISAKQ